MRVVVIGASTSAVMAAGVLRERGHEIVVIEKDRKRIDELYETVDVSFLHGDGSKPQLLREAGPSKSDLLLCLTDNDQVNIIASLVGRQLGYERIVTAITDPEFESICRELELEQVVLPPRTISRYLADIAEGVNVLELSTYIRGDARFFMFRAPADLSGTRVSDLGLPDEARFVCAYRDGELATLDEGMRIREGDEVVLFTHQRRLPELEERFRPMTNDG